MSNIDRITKLAQKSIAIDSLEPDRERAYAVMTQAKRVLGDSGPVVLAMVKVIRAANDMRGWLHEYEMLADVRAFDAAVAELEKCK